MWSSFVSIASSEALKVKEAKAVPNDLGNVGPIGTCVVADIDGEVAAAAEAATCGEATAIADGDFGTSIGSDEADEVADAVVNDGVIGVCAEVVAAAEAAAAGEAAAAAAAVADGKSGAFAVETSIGSCEADAAVVGEGDGDNEMVILTVVDFPLGVTGVLMVGGLLKAGPLLAGVRPICQ